MDMDLTFYSSFQHYSFFLFCIWFHFFLSSKREKKWFFLVLHFAWNSNGNETGSDSLTNFSFAHFYCSILLSCELEILFSLCLCLCICGRIKWIIHAIIFFPFSSSWFHLILFHRLFRGRIPIDAHILSNSFSLSINKRKCKKSLHKHTRSLGCTPL